MSLAFQRFIYRGEKCEMFYFKFKFIVNLPILLLVCLFVCFVCLSPSPLVSSLLQMSHNAVAAFCRSVKLQCELYPSREVAICLDPYCGLGFVLWCLCRLVQLLNASPPTYKPLNMHFTLFEDPPVIYFALLYVKEWMVQIKAAQIWACTVCSCSNLVSHLRQCVLFNQIQHSSSSSSEQIRRTGTGRNGTENF